MIRPISSKFVTSVPNISLAGNFGLSEIAFLGRSNVGKSSLINAILNHKGLAKSSSTPGKTQLIVFFETCFEFIANQDETQKVKLMFVDLPGFGYAKVSKSMHDDWKKNLDEFLKKRTDIRLFVQLRDSRHFDMDIDQSVSDYLSSFIRPDQSILRVYTKADKLNQSMLAKLNKFDPECISVSTLNGRGIDKLRELIIKRSLGIK